MADFYGGRFSTAANGAWERSNGLRFPTWNGTDANNSTTVVTSQYEVRSDHVCKPVIIGSDGKAIPAYECPPKHHHAKDDPAAGGYGRSWVDTPTGGDSYAYKRDPYKVPAFISGVQTFVSSDPTGKFGLGGSGQVLHRPTVDSYDYDDDDDKGFRYDEYGSSRAEPWRSADAGRGWKTRNSAAAEPTWGAGSNYGGGATRVAAGWGGEGKLSSATNVIEKAVEFLYDTPARPVGGGIARTDAWGGSQQPASMYQSASMYQPAKRSTVAGSVIDSREAAKKYGGQFIW